MKKLIGLMITLTLVISLCACGGQPAVEQKAESGAAAETDTKEVTEATSESADADSGGVTQADIEKNIVGTWIKAEIDGQTALTNEKSIFDIVSITEAYTSASHQTDEGTPFDYNQKSKVDINGNVVTITTMNSEGESYVHEFTVTSISDSRITANHKFTRTLEGEDPLTKEETVTFVKVNDDYSSDIIGTWEGHCTSEGSVFDDGQEHRWEFKDDGTYVYYVKDGDKWVPADAAEGDYFVAGNLLCGRWFEGKTENREWWEISIDGDKMNWTALREGEDGKIFTATFDMKRVEDASGDVTQADIEKNIVGMWIKSEVDGQPALTNEKIVFDIVSTTEAYESISRTDEATPFDGATPFAPADKGKVDINGNVVTITLTPTKPDVKSVENKFTVTDISDSGFTADIKHTLTLEGTDPIIKEETVTFVKVNDDYSDDIIGTWEGRCTSEGSVFDDGQDHRWEFKDDGTFVYYVKDGDSWVLSEDTMNEYFVAGNLLCSRWMENGQENREWWELSIDGDKMNWTALREDEDGKTFTATFDMKRIEDASGVVTQADIEKNIIGSWILSKEDGKPVLTNDKNVFDIVSTTEAYSSGARVVAGAQTPWHNHSQSQIDISGNVVTITYTPFEDVSSMHELVIADIGANEFTANRKFTRVIEGSEPEVRENLVTYVKVNGDCGEGIIGTWEGRCTSEGSVFDDGQDHRWEFKDDGTFVYYVKDGDSWVLSEDTMNEYFVAGNLLCSRWMENGQENREWWEITIDGDTMNWTALREGEDGKTFTATFEMKKIKG